MQRHVPAGVNTSIYWLALCAFLLCTQALADVPSHWKSTRYAYETEYATLRHTLMDFAHSFGLRVVFSEGEFEQVISGKFSANAADAFLDRLALEHQFEWFVFNGKLYISPADAHTVERITASDLTAGALKKAMQAIGLLDDRFGWGELPSQHVVLISGPKAYVDLVRSLAKGDPKNDGKPHVMAFKLHHASVTDRTIRYRDNHITIPGVASVLRDILSQSTRSPATTHALQQAADNSKQTQTRAAGADAINRFKTLVGGTTNKQMVTADVRNNALLIHDVADKRDYYQGILNNLDVPLRLLDISAVIIDVNREKLEALGINWLFADTTEPLDNGSALVVKKLGDFMLRLNALNSRGDVRITASPSVMTQENHPAVIDLSQTVHQTATGERVVQFQKVTAGTSLQVIPRVVSSLTPTHDLDDALADVPRIQLVVDIEDGSLLPEINNNIVVQTSNLSTQTVIKHGHALVLGGFTLQRHEQQHQQVPYLGSTSGVGRLFRNDRQLQRQSQRLFLLIPRLVEPDRASTMPKPRARLVASPIRRNVINHAFTQLAQGFIPSGFTQERPQHTPLCERLQQRLDFTHAQWLTNDEFMIAVARVTPPTNAANNHALDPSECEGHGVLAVSFWPPQPTADMIDAEVFIAFQPWQEQHTP